MQLAEESDQEFLSWEEAEVPIDQQLHSHQEEIPLCSVYPCHLLVEARHSLHDFQA